MTEEKKFPSMAAFVRAQPISMSTAAVAELGQTQGFEKLTPQRVYNYRWQETERANKSKPVAKTASKKGSSPKAASKKAASKKATQNHGGARVAKAAEFAPPSRIAQPDEEPHVKEFLAMFSARGEFALMSIIRRTIRRELRKMLGGIGAN